MTSEEKATIEATIILLHDLAREHSCDEYRRMADLVASLLKQNRDIRSGRYDCTTW